jgi:hypothetical protein
MSERAAAIAAQWEAYQHGNLIYRNSLEGQSCPKCGKKTMFAAVPNRYLTPTCSRMSFLTMGRYSLITLTQTLSLHEFGDLDSTWKWHDCINS